MRLGCCGPLDSAKSMKQAGFDFIEVSVQAVLRGQEPDDAWAADAPNVDQIPLPIEAANGLVPGDLPIVGSNRDVAALTTYMQRVASRAKRLGIQRLVFGSGKARLRPDDVDEQTAFEQIAEFCRLAGDACAANDVTLVIEHLNKGETNTINSLAEELRLMEKVDHPAVAALIDSYHFGIEEESDQAVLDLGDRVEHVHVAEPVGRVEPGAADGDDAYDFDNFFCLLRKIGYEQRISIECRWTGTIDDKGPAAVAFLRDAWQRSGRCES